MYKLKTNNNQHTNAQANTSVSTSTGLRRVISVRRPSSRSSSWKNSVLSHTKIHPENVEVHARKNKNTNVTSQVNVVKTNDHVANVNAENALKVNVSVLCVSCNKNVLTPCHDKCLARYKLFVNSKVRRALFTTANVAKSKFLDITLVVTKTRFVVFTPLNAKDKDSSDSLSTSLFKQVKTLRNYMQIKVKTSRKWQKWFKKQPNFSWSPKSETTKTSPSVTKGRDNVVSHSRTPVPFKKWVAKLSTLPSMFSPYIAGTICFGNDHFAAITGYGDYVHGNVTICHVYYVKGLRHNLFSIGQLCDGDLEVAFRSKTCYVRNLEGEDLLSGVCDSNLYTISISYMVASFPIC
ncbi:hypothetical protein Tco_1273631 [Tanacetum coccineum]